MKHTLGTRRLEAQGVSLCPVGVRALSASVQLVREVAARVGWKDAVLSDVALALRPPEGHWKGSALRAHGGKSLGGEKPCQRWRMGDCGSFWRKDSFILKMTLNA